jgi:hypothetical protein
MDSVMFVVSKYNDQRKDKKTAGQDTCRLTHKPWLSSEKSHHAENHREQQKRDDPGNHGRSFPLLTAQAMPTAPLI